MNGYNTASRRYISILPLVLAVLLMPGLAIGGAGPVHGAEVSTGHFASDEKILRERAEARWKEVLS